MIFEKFTKTLSLPDVNQIIPAKSKLECAALCSIEDNCKGYQFQGQECYQADIVPIIDEANTNNAVSVMKKYFPPMNLTGHFVEVTHNNWVSKKSEGIMSAEEGKQFCASNFTGHQGHLIMPK